ncbi:MAG: hypothetical protein WC325_13540, partial [Candidatus Bathyarchaeia archaeon]
IGGRYESITSNPTQLQTTTAPAQSIAKTKDQEEQEEYKMALREAKRQGQEDKAYADMNEQIHLLNSAENEAFKDLIGRASDVAIEIAQGVVSTIHSWEGGLAWLKRNNESRFQNIMPYIMLFAVFIGILVFLSINPDLMNQLIAATQNPILDATIIGVVAAATAVAIYYLKRRRGGD